MAQPVVHVWLDGHIVPAAEASIPIDDRSFRYGDGLFETMLVRSGAPLFWVEHLRRLESGARLLQFPPIDLGAVLPGALELISRNGHFNGVLRLHLSRGGGPRGYSPKGANQPRLLLTTDRPPDPIRRAKPLSVTVARHPLYSRDPFGPFKTANKLPQILAKTEAEWAGFDDAILLNEHGHAVAATSANLLALIEGRWTTPPLDSGCLAGVTRALLLAHAPRHGVELVEVPLRVEDLRRARSLAFCSSILGVAPVCQLEGRALEIAAPFSSLKHVWEELISQTQPNAPYTE